jgi:hypothetical protein
MADYSELSVSCEGVIYGAFSVYMQKEFEP